MHQRNFLTTLDYPSFIHRLIDETGVDSADNSFFALLSGRKRVLFFASARFFFIAFEFKFGELGAAQDRKKLNKRACSKKKRLA